MALPLKDWLATDEVKRFQAMSTERAAHEYFFRNPPRVMWGNDELFAAPADGVITTQGRFDPEEDLIDVKGANISVNSVLTHRFAIDTPALVSCIFMTAADVHWNRCPTNVVMARQEVESVRTANLPMLWTEEGLLDAGLIRKGTFGYMTANTRVVSKCYCPPLDYTYWLVQIADSEINCIVPVDMDKLTGYCQNERFGQIIWGSMCVLILPLTDKFSFNALWPKGTHVEATNDPLVSVERR